MLFGYRTGVILPSVALAAALTLVTPPPPRPCALDTSLYSARALRRIRTVLALRLLELREERLERAREVIMHRLPVDALFTPEPKLPPERQGAQSTRLKQTGVAQIMTCQ